MRTLLAIFVLAALASGSARAQEKSWAGKTIITKKAGVKIDFNEDTPPLPSGWKDFTNKDAGYSAAMPGTPEEAQWDVPIKGGKIKLTMNLVKLDEPIRLFGVGFGDCPAGQDYTEAATANKEMEKVLTGLVAPLKGAVVKKRAMIRLDNHHGQEWHIDLPDGEKQIYRVYQVRERMYALLSAWAPKYDGAKEADIFLNFFALLGQVKITRGTGTLDEIQYRVLAENKGRLKVVTPAGAGWIDKTDAVPLDEAAAFFTERIRTNPTEARAFHVRGLVSKLEGKLDAAIKDYTKSLDLERQATVYHNRAVAYHATRDYDKALEDYTEAITLERDLLPSYYGRGVVLNERKEYDKASDDFTRVISLDPKNFAAYNGRGDALRGKKEYAKAIADYTEALKLDKGQPFVLNNRGLANFLKKDDDSALKDFAASEKLDPKNAWVYKNRARLLATSLNAKFRDGKQAIEQAKKALALEKQPDGDFHATLAAAHAEAGDFTAAIRAQEQALMDPRLMEDEDALGRLELYKKKLPYRQK